MNALTETTTLVTGAPIPRIGFGTWLLDEGEQCYRAVSEALRLGYRHLDTARAYHNEASIGRAVRDSGIPREDIFVTAPEGRRRPAQSNLYRPHPPKRRTRFRDQHHRHGGSRRPA